MTRETIRRILVPTDFSASSRAALEYAVALARAFDAQASVLHVVERAECETMPESRPLSSSAGTDELRRAKKDISAAVERLRADGVTAHQCLVEGEPLSQIVRVAVEEKADFIVMGAHGREGSPRTWLGCTIERVMRRAPCPVVAVREDHQLAWPRGSAGSRERGEEVILERAQSRNNS